MIFASQDGTARIWSTATGEQLFSAQFDTSLFSASISADADSALLATFDALYVWHFREDSTLVRLRLNEREPLSIEISDDGRVAIASTESSVYFIDIEESSILKSFKLEFAASEIFFSEDYLYAIALGGDQMAKITLSSGAFSTKKLSGTVAAVSRNGERLLLETDGIVTGIEFDAGRKIERNYVGNFLPGERLLTFDGGHFFSISSGHISLHDFGSGLEKQFYSGHTGAILSGVYLRQSNDLLIANLTSIDVWDLDQGRIDLQIPTPHLPVRRVAHLPNQDLLVTGHNNGILRFWFLENGIKIPIMRQFLGTSISNLVASQAMHDGGEDRLLVQTLYDGSYLLTMSWSSSAPIGVIPFQPESGTTTYAGAISGDDSMVATTSSNSSVAVWTSDDGSTVRIFDELTALPRSLAFSPNGDLLAIGLYEGKIVVYEVQSGRLKATFAGHQ